jgi:hypothetical protein
VRHSVQRRRVPALSRAPARSRRLRFAECFFQAGCAMHAALHGLPDRGRRCVNDEATRARDRRVEEPRTSKGEPRGSTTTASPNPIPAPARWMAKAASRRHAGQGQRACGRVPWFANSSSARRATLEGNTDVAVEETDARVVLRPMMSLRGPERPSTCRLLDEAFDRPVRS